jgi:hypothetical protein
MGWFQARLNHFKLPRANRFGGNREASRYVYLRKPENQAMSSILLETEMMKQPEERKNERESNLVENSWRP